MQKPARTDKEVVPGVNYTFNVMHRNNTPGKSQWLLSENSELNVFLKSYEEAWHANDQYAWGLFFAGDFIDYLGYAQDHSTEVFIAKFVHDVPHRTWHGYPADHHDIPQRTVLESWRQRKLLSAAKIRKILRGQPCKL